YQKFSIGFYHEHNLSSIQLSYIAGSRAIRGTLGESWLYTQPAVDSIDIYAQGNMFRTDRFYPYWAFQGNGFSIDVNYNFIFQGKVKNRQIINFKINNLGLIFWNKQTNKFVVDLNDTYTGYDVQDLMNQDSSADNTINWQDTLGVTTYV